MEMDNLIVLLLLEEVTVKEVSQYFVLLCCFSILRPSQLELSR